MLITTFFIAATASIGLRTTKYLSTSSVHLDPYNLGVTIIAILANGLMDVFSIWRCYHFWGRSRVRVLNAPCAVSALTHVYGLSLIFWGREYGAQINKTPVFAIFVLLALVGKILLLTVLTAGRLLYIACHNWKDLQFCETVSAILRTMVSVAIESSLIYLVWFAAYAVVMISNELWADSEVYPVQRTDLIFDSLVTIMGITSTLIIVRIPPGTTTHGEEWFIKEHGGKDIERTVDPDIEAQRSTRRRWTMWLF
ncbi:hypothetical protein PM082_024194 [Marasmius tenuissimus]|nr:hypothetical protein PM082_024194 [Marasmius tenuissimus]